MGDVVRISFELPTVAFTGLIALSIVVWSISLAGFGDAEDAADGFLEGLLSPLGLVGVPVNVSLSLFALVAWAASAVLHLTVLAGATGVAAVLFAIGVGLAAIVASLLVMRVLAPKLSDWFTPAYTHRVGDLVGRPVEIRSTTVTTSMGYGDVRTPDGSVDRVDLRVRPDRGRALDFGAGDSALIIDYEPTQHVFIIDQLPASMRQ